jgi:hypothetical protein
MHSLYDSHCRPLLKSVPYEGEKNLFLLVATLVARNANETTVESGAHETKAR